MTIPTTEYSYQTEHQGTFYFPAETAPHQATILGFPSPHSVPGDLLTATRYEIMDLAVVISEFEAVRMHVRAEEEDLARDMLKKRFRRLNDDPRKASGKRRRSGKTRRGKDEDKDKPEYHLDRITFHVCPTNHPWARDTGPVYVLDRQQPGKRIAVDFGFCEWGGKNKAEIDVRNETISDAQREDDERAPVPRKGYATPDERHWENARFAKRVLELDNYTQPLQSEPSLPVEEIAPVQRVIAPIRLEGGAIEVDGEGTLLATESSIIGQYRNGNLSKADIEEHLRDLLGVTKIIWFPGRKGYDITDCHVDGEARFLEPGLVVLSKPHGRAGKMERQVFKEVYDILSRETDAQGRKFKVVTLEEPDPEMMSLPADYGEGYSNNDDYDSNGDDDEQAGKGDDEIAGSYVNFYFVNGGLVFPVFGDTRRDRMAVETMRKHVPPERKIREILMSALPSMGGMAHCVTQQVV